MRPKCQFCDRAMKTPLHRKGAKSTIKSIRNWWYCETDNRMTYIPYEIPTEKAAYMDQRGADIYPTISIARQQHQDYEVGVISDLEQFHELKAKWKWETYNDTLVRELPIAPIYVAWECQKCDAIVENTDDIIMKEDLLEEELIKVIPEHCNHKMKLRIISAERRQQELLESLVANIHHSLDESNFQRVALLFLDLVILYLESRFILYRSQYHEEFKFTDSNNLYKHIMRINNSLASNSNLLTQWPYLAGLELMFTLSSEIVPTYISTENYAQVIAKYTQDHPVGASVGKSTSLITKNMEQMFSNIKNIVSNHNPDLMFYYHHKFRKIIFGIELRMNQTRSIDNISHKIHDDFDI